MDNLCTLYRGVSPAGILADDLGLIFISMLDLQRGTKHVRNCYFLFGLKIHRGIEESVEVERMAKILN